MKMIDVLNLMAEGEIKANTTLIIYDDSGGCSFLYSEKDHRFFNKYSNRLEDFRIDKHFLNLEVELIPPKEKKYLIKVNVPGLRENFAYLNYTKSRNRVVIHGKVDCSTYKTHFTKDELQSIKPVREFLEYMQGKYTLVEVEE